jgi:hypothetical protein
MAFPDRAFPPGRFPNRLSSHAIERDLGAGGDTTTTNQSLIGIPTANAAVAIISQSTQANTSVPGGNTIANTASPTTFASTGTIAANTAAVGNVYRVTLYGTYGTAVVGPTLTIDIHIGSTVVTTTGAFAMTGSLANDGWRAEALIIVNTAGAAGVVEAQGSALFGIAGATGLAVLNPNLAPVSGIDFTATNSVYVVATWNAANASNTITLRQFVLEKLL